MFASVGGGNFDEIVGEVIKAASDAGQKPDII